MTACFKLMKALQSKERHPAHTTLCEPCVYFSKNIDKAELPELTNTLRCGLGFTPGESRCSEMRTNNCRMRKDRS